VLVEQPYLVYQEAEGQYLELCRDANYQEPEATLKNCCQPPHLVYQVREAHLVYQVREAKQDETTHQEKDLRTSRLYNCQRQGTMD
jgi:hypothetical protein